MFSPKSMISLVTDPLKGLFFSTFSLNFFLDYFQHIPFYLVNCCIFCLFYLRFEKFIILKKKNPIITMVIQRHYLNLIVSVKAKMSKNEYSIHRCSRLSFYSC